MKSSPNGMELELNELNALHQQWLQSPETQTVIKALKKHADNHTAVTLQNSCNGAVDASVVKQQASIAYNLHLVIDIMSNPQLIFKLLNPNYEDKTAQKSLTSQ
jgi:hypothetical protein